MFVHSGLGAAPWLLIEASQQGVLRFATADPQPRPRVANVSQMDIGGVPTFTDALQRFERESGLSLKGLRCTMAVAGPTSGETLSPARSRWTITRTGLAALFGEPVTIINDVAARAWAVGAGTARIDALRGFGVPDLTRAGRYVMIMVEEGVGPAVIDVDRQGLVHILDAEAGHMEFPAGSAVEQRLAQALRGNHSYVSWERMLMLDVRDPMWAAVWPESDRRARSHLLASILERFAISLVYAYAAWDGVLITGSRGIQILQGGNRSLFGSGLTSRRTFNRLISNCPVWTVDQREAVLTGAAECLAQGARAPMRRAA